MKPIADLSQAAWTYGPAMVGFAVLLIIILRQNVAAERRADKMLERIIHGDGNGSASIGKVLTSVEDHGRRLTAVEAKVDALGIKADRLQREGCDNLGKRHVAASKAVSA